MLENLMYGLLVLAIIVVGVTVFMLAADKVMDVALRIFPGFADWFYNLPLNK